MFRNPGCDPQGLTCRTTCESVAHASSGLRAYARTQTIVSPRKNALLFIKIKSANFSRFMIIRKTEGEITGKTAELSRRIPVLFCAYAQCIEHKNSRNRILVFPRRKCYPSAGDGCSAASPPECLTETVFNRLPNPTGARGRDRRTLPGSGSHIAQGLGNFPFPYGAIIFGVRRRGVFRFTDNAHY